MPVDDVRPLHLATRIFKRIYGQPNETLRVRVEKNDRQRTT